MVDKDELVLALQRGERDAVARAYELFHERVRTFARRLLHDESAAEDLVHEVFVTLPSAIRSFRGESALPTFLVGIAVRHARHHVRAAARRRAAMERLSLAPPPDGAPDAEDRAYAEQLARALSRAMDKLPDDQRAVFVLCEMDERTSAEVAMIVGAPEGTVRTRLFHAKRKLRDILEREGFR
ncbi:RNA polymerase sigma factor [Pendulispora brunnea]|uniref:RNA polymerase sigma factor n=1 Tax=Pendulispora brunnea TaxID=2905690 RepID=UPI00374E1985